MSAGLTRAFAALLALALCACVAAPRQTEPADPRRPPSGSPALTHDHWRALIPVPFGSALRDVPFALKEILLFQGDSRSAGDADEQECYSKSGEPLRFKGAETEDYVVCFFHEHLFRVEAALRLPKDTPSATFTRWCEDWLSDTTAVARAPDTCQGQQETLEFSAKVTNDSDLAGPLITLAVYDVAARLEYDQRASAK